jgi:hypothetical protein
VSGGIYMSRKGLLRKSSAGGVSDFLNRLFDGQSFGYMAT